MTRRSEQRRLRLRAPAKINWTLEVLHVRPDGYHELRSVLQTIDLCDIVTLDAAKEVELVLGGASGPLADEPPERNLAFRAADALRKRTGATLGVRIELEKQIPVAAGLGGGSSDAAAVLRGCNELWNCGQDDANLTEIAAEIGSDPPFFVVGGTASVSGRGDVVRRLPDAKAPAVLVASPPAHHRGEKTAQMYASLSPSMYGDGYVTIGLEDVVEAGRDVFDAALNNVFERVTSQMQPETEIAMDALRAQGVTPHLAGSGPSFFLLLDGDADALSQRIRDVGFEPRLVRTMSRKDALRIEEL
jgi:4-diphosphocytidyl-2-C-methyl-D-erythritol kinase